MGTSKQGNSKLQNHVLKRTAGGWLHLDNELQVKGTRVTMGPIILLHVQVYQIDFAASLTTQFLEIQRNTNIFLIWNVLLNRQGSNYRDINQRSRLLCHKQILCSFLFLPYSLSRKCVVHLCRVWAGNPLTSVQFSHSVMSYSLWFHGLQHAKLPCPSQTPGACSNSCPSTQWCHLTISSSVIPFSSCLQSFPASGSFPVSQFFASGGQSIWVLASASVLPMNIQDWFPLGWTGLSPCCKGLSRVFSNTTVQELQFFCAQLSSWSNSHIRIWLLELWLYGPKHYL